MTPENNNRAFLLTPPGAGAIGVVRVVGPDALSVVEQFFQSKSGVSLSKCRVDRLYYGDIVVNDEIIDDVIISRISYPEPSALDICSHGGVRIIERILQALEDQGIQVTTYKDENQPLWPISTTMEKEADEALTEAKTIRAVRFLTGQRNCLPAALHEVAETCNDKPEEARKQFETFQAGYPIAKQLIEGVTIAIIGPPNSGKSTLFNRLIGRSATVVSARAGTTRDWIEEPIEIDGVPIRLVDTAGRHDHAMNLEKRAISAGIERVKTAKLRLLILDGAQDLSVDRAVPLQAELTQDGTIIILNKRDLPSFHPAIGMGGEISPVCISARTGFGLEKLYERILKILGFEGWNEDFPCLFTLRQARTAADILAAFNDAAADTGAFIRNRLIGCGSSDIATSSDDFHKQS